MNTVSAILLTLSLSLVGLLLPHFNKIFAPEYLAYILIIECIILIWYVAYVAYGWRKRRKTFYQSHIMGVLPMIISCCAAILNSLFDKPAQSGFLYEVPIVREIMSGAINYIYYLLWPATEYIYPIDNVALVYYTLAMIFVLLIFTLGYKTKKF